MHYYKYEMMILTQNESHLKSKTFEGLRLLNELDSSWCYGITTFDENCFSFLEKLEKFTMNVRL